MIDYLQAELRIDYSDDVDFDVDFEHGNGRDDVPHSAGGPRGARGAGTVQDVPRRDTVTGFGGCEPNGNPEARIHRRS